MHLLASIMHGSAYTVIKNEYFALEEIFVSSAKQTECLYNGIFSGFGQGTDLSIYVSSSPILIIYQALILNNPFGSIGTSSQLNCKSPSSETNFYFFSINTTIPALKLVSLNS